MKGGIVVTGCAGLIGSHLTDRPPAEGRAVVGIHPFVDYFPQANEQANVAATCAQAGFTLAETCRIDLTAVDVGSGFLSDEEGSESSR